MRSVEAIQTPDMGEYQVLRLANDRGKFAIEFASPQLQQALERLQLKRWVTLIDVSPVAAYPGRLFRVFLATPEALSWRDEFQEKYGLDGGA